MNLGKNLASFFHEEFYLYLKAENERHFATWRVHSLVMAEVHSRVFLSTTEVPYSISLNLCV